MNKYELIGTMAVKAGLSKTDSGRALDAVLKTIVQVVIEGAA